LKLIILPDLLVLLLHVLVKVNLYISRLWWTLQRK